MAFLALFWIIISVIGTGLIIIFDNNSNQQIEYTPEQIEQIQQYMDSLSGSTMSWTTASWEILEIK